MHFDKAFIIGLPKHTKNRLDKTFQLFKEQDVNAMLWEGIYGLDVNIKEYQTLGYLSDDFYLHLPGSLGCMLSHITLWESVEKDPDCDIAFICEDDILLNKNFLRDLESIPWSDVPDDWDIIKLSYHKLNGEQISDTIVKPSLVTKPGTNSGTFCYLMKTSSAQTLKNILVPYNGQLSMDVLLRQNFSNFNPYLLKNRLAVEERFRYSIRKDLNFSARKLSIFEKLFMKISRLFLS